MISICVITFVYAFLFKGLFKITAHFSLKIKMGKTNLYIFNVFSLPLLSLTLYLYLTFSSHNKNYKQTFLGI